MLAFGMSACTFLQSSNINWSARSSNPIIIPTPTPVPTYCDSIICRASLDSNDIEGNGASGKGGVRVSGNGRYVVFESLANNLVVGDSNGFSDVFMKDMQTGVTTLISSDSLGIQGDGSTNSPSISFDGRYIVFSSESTNLVSGDVNGVRDIFLKDTQTGATKLISSDSLGIQGGGVSNSPSISFDGRYIVFSSESTNLISGDINSTQDIFLKDTQTGVTTLISSDSFSVQSNGHSRTPWISSDGRYVVFESGATNFVSGDMNGDQDIFKKDIQTGVITLISSDSSSIQSNSYSGYASISSDGRYVAFMSAATNLVAGDVNGMEDVFMKDTLTGVTTLISSDSSGVQGNNNSTASSITADGRYVVFHSKASNLVTGDTNSFQDIFIKDTQTDVTILISSDSTGLQGNNTSNIPSVSSDGSYVAFLSRATNLVPNDTNGVDDIFYKRIVP